jgi:hypothetical protein
MIFFLLGYHFNGKVRASQFAEFAADTVLGPYRHGLFFIIELEDVFRAELNTYAASLAPFPVNHMRF